MNIKYTYFECLHPHFKGLKLSYICKCQGPGFHAQPFTKVIVQFLQRLRDREFKQDLIGISGKEMFGPINEYNTWRRRYIYEHTNRTKRNSEHGKLQRIRLTEPVLQSKKTGCRS